MVWTFAYHTFLQNHPLGGKSKLAGAALTEDNNTLTVLRAPTPAIALPVISALFFVAQYSEDNL